MAFFLTYRIYLPILKETFPYSHNSKDFSSPPYIRYYTNIRNLNPDEHFPLHCHCLISGMICAGVR